MRGFAVGLLLSVIVSPTAGDYVARVVGVADGDTITVLTADKTQGRIRLNGIDAPETGQDFGSRAKEAASELAFGKIVTIQPLGADRYGRDVANVILPDGKMLNREMVRQGMAWWYRKYAPNDAELAKLEAEAKTTNSGLWSQPNPIPPWDWRNGQGMPKYVGFVGNQKTRVYHSPNCRGAASMKLANRVSFMAAADAESAGYRRARDCP
jgi:micrococcal nuclease